MKKVLFLIPLLFVLTLVLSGVSTALHCPGSWTTDWKCSENQCNCDCAYLTSDPGYGNCCSDSSTNIWYSDCTCTNCCVTSWSPAASTVCSGQSFTQTSNCGTTRSTTGTKDCTPPTVSDPIVFSGDTTNTLILSSVVSDSSGIKLNSCQVQINSSSWITANLISGTCQYSYSPTNTFNLKFRVSDTLNNIGTSNSINFCKYHRDSDGDTYGNLTNWKWSANCVQPAGYVIDKNDCNDDISTGGDVMFPGNPEFCDGLDNDCDGEVDEDNVCSTFLNCTSSSTDIDSDSLTYNYKWFVLQEDGSTTEVGSDSTLDVTSYNLNTTIFMCEVYANDGTENSLVGRKSFTNSRDKNYIPFGVLDTEITNIGPYSNREAIPKNIIISTNEEFTYEQLVSCYNGECGNVNSDIMYTIFYLDTISGMRFNNELYGNLYTTEGVSLLSSVSDDIFSTTLSNIIRSQYSEIYNLNSESYTIKGKGDIPTAECTSFYVPYFVMTATVNYRNGSSEDFEDLIIYNDEVENVVLNTKIYYDIPTGAIEVAANSETIFSSDDLTMMSLCGNGMTNCFTHVPNSLLNYPAITNLTASITDENLDLLVDDPCLREKLRNAQDSIEIQVETPDFPKTLLFDPVYDNLCLENFDNLPLPIYAKLELFDDTTRDIRSSENFSVELDTIYLESLIGTPNTATFESMVEVDVTLSQNKFGQNVQTIQIEKTPSFNLTDFSNLFSEVPANVKPRVDITATYEENGNEINGTTYFMINTSCNAQDSNCTYYYSESGRREYFWAFDGLDIDDVDLIEKCGIDDIGSVVDDTRVELNIAEETTADGIVLIDGAPGECGNTEIVNDASCYRIEEAGVYNLSISVDDVVIPYLYVEATADCAFTSLQVLDDEYGANDPNNDQQNLYEIMKGESFEVDELDVSCLLGAELQSTRYCKTFTAKEIYENETVIDLSIVSNDTSSLGYSAHIATVLGCGVDTIKTDFEFDTSNAESISFCNEAQNDSRDFFMPPEHVRDTRCSIGNDVIKSRFLANHLSSYAARNSTELSVYLANRTLNDYVQYIEKVIEDTELTDYFKNSFVNPDGTINEDSLRTNTNTDVNDFLGSTSGDYELEFTNIRNSNQTLFSLHNIKKQYLLANSDEDKFIEDLSNLVNVDLSINCTKEAYRLNTQEGSFTVSDALSNECEAIALSIMFEPGVYIAENEEFEYCYVDWDTTDTACCDNTEVGDNPCVYDGTCYSSDTSSQYLLDNDQVLEVCTTLD